jgi:hypothetical protein
MKNLKGPQIVIVGLLEYNKSLHRKENHLNQKEQSK